MTKFLDRFAVWPRLKTLAKKHQGCVAVAFVGSEAPALLPLRKGSTLIVDASDATVKAGATSPKALLKFHRRGVNLYRVDHLHAKIYLFGRRLVLSSNNVSASSSRTLEEAALETTERAAIKDAQRFIARLEKTPLGPDELQRLSKIYRPPRFFFTGAKTQPGNSRFWLVPLDTGDWDADAKAAAKQMRPKAKRQLKSQDFELQEFYWEGGDLPVQLARDDVVVQVVETNRGRTEIIRPARVVAIKRYRTTKRNTRAVVVFLRVKRKNASLTLKQIKPRDAALHKELRGLKTARRPRSASLRRSLYALWPE